METDENGRACADIDCIEDGEGRMHSAIGKDGFVILQTKGTEGYYLNKPLFSAEMDTKENDGSVQWTGSQDNLEITKYALARFVKKKTTGEGTTEPEAGAEFKVRKNDDTYLEDPDGNTIVCTADKNGVVYVPWLLNGVYTLEQTKGSSLHEKLSESTDANAVFAVNENALVFEKKEMSAFLETKNEGSLTEAQKKQVVVVGDDKGQFTDAELPVKVTLQKTSTFTGVLLKDTEFTLYKKEAGNWKEVGKYYTGDGEEGTELGKVTIHGLSFGTYKVKETKAPAGYLPSEYDQKVGSDDPDFQWQEKEFVIDASHVVKEDDGELAYRENIDMADSAVLKFRDTPIFGKIRINKTGNVLIDYTKSTDDFAYNTSGIGGATYALYAAEDIYDDAGNLIWRKDTKICQADTDADGYASFKNNTVDYTDDFFMGRYYIKETKAPAGFDLDTQTHEVTLTWDAGAKKLEMEDWQPDVTEYKEQESHGDYFLCTGEQLNPYIINAKKVIFTYEKAPKNAKAVYDVSSDRVGTKDNPTIADANSTVVLWEDPVESGTFYISTQTTANEVIFNKISSDMFYKCQALKSVIFFHVDTSYMVYADRMFAYDTSLKKLDLSNWVTGSLNSTVEMFANSGVLEKVYIGDTEQKVIGDEEPVATGIHTTPRQAKYLYTDPAQEEEDTLQTRKFTADSFNYALCYSDGEAESITITDEDIASIHPEYPDQMGKLTVTIRLKPDSRYYAQAKDGGEENGVLKVTVDVVDPASLKLDPVVDEHPEASVDVEDTQKSVALSILKIDADKKGTADEERAGLEATFEVYAATDLKNYNGDTIIKEGERIQTIKSIDKDTDDGGRAGTDSLPTGYYAVDPNASYLYKVVETVPPKGYALYPDEKKNTAYIPNLDYLNANSETILSTIKKANADTISATYSLSENTYTFALTFTDIKAPTITKNWGERRTEGYVEETDRPESLTIHMYTDKGKTDLYKTITLTKEKKWIYAFDHDIDLTKYYYEEEVPDDAVWKINDQEYKDGYFKDGATNCVTFYNWSKEHPEYVIPSVTKYWEDNENAPQKRPDKIDVTLLQNGMVIRHETLSESNNWTFTVAEKDALPKYDDVGQEYVYTWEEDLSTLPKEYEQTNTKTTTSSNGQYTYIHTDITNTYAQYTSAEISKLWDDESDLYKLRPASVTVHLLANGKQVNKLTLESNETGKTKTTDITDGNIVLSKDNKWSAKAVNLPKYDGKKKIEYTWKEEEVPDYELTSNLTVTKDAETVTEKTETTMTNKLIPSSGSVAVSKLIPVSSLDIRHGDIDFTFTIKGKTIHNKEYTDKKTVTFTKDIAATQDNVVTIDGKAYVKLSVSFAGLDWGEYKITESGSESRYQFNKISGLVNATTGKEKDGTPYVAFTVDKTHQEFSGTFENVTIPGSIKIVKHGKSKKDKLKGVTFKIEKILAGNKTKLVDTKETDEDGQILFEALEPGDYLITETKTLPGYTLLKAPFKATIPMAMTAKEAAEQKADTTKATYDKANALYYFYDLTYDVDNEAIPSVPMTGAFDNWKTFVPIILAMALFIGVGVYQMKKRKKPAK